MTFSIIASDPQNNQIGYAVASRTFSVGIIGFSNPSVGAILCQGETNFNNGTLALELIAEGKSLEETVNEIKKVDLNTDTQQFGLADLSGNVYSFTGSECSPWSGHQIRDRYACQGNILTGPDVIEKMCETFESTEGLLVERLMAALVAGDASGGDSRGKQSASIKVISPKGGFAGSDIVADLHIYDHIEPVVELDRVTKIAVSYMKTFMGIIE